MTCATCGSVAPHLADTAPCPSCQLRAHRDPNKTVMWFPPPGVGAPPAARAPRRLFLGRLTSLVAALVLLRRKNRA